MVVEAGSAAETLRCLAESHPFDVIVLDYRLPDRQDLTLLAAVREASPNAVILMMTAFGEEDMRRDAVALGARGVIDKPFQVSDVIAQIEAR
jgi:DNA-binding NarL/FixJ family response regulator